MCYDCDATPPSLDAGFVDYWLKFAARGQHLPAAGRGGSLIMNNTEEIHRLESELENRKDCLRDDAEKISQKIDGMKAQMNPANFIRQRPGLSLGVALILGTGTELLSHLLLKRRGMEPEMVVPPALNKLGKPLVQLLLTAAAREVATRAIRG